MAKRNERLWCAVVIAAAISACASSEPSSAGSGATVGRCMQGMTLPCTCVDGRPGAQNCQLDGAFGVCNCNGAVAPQPGATAGTSAVPAAGASAMMPGVGAAGMGAQAAGTGGGAVPVAGASGEVPDVSGVVMVDSADVSACTGAGSPPTAGEEVEVLQIRTSDVIPGGFVAAGGTIYACFWVEIDMPEKHHIIGWEGAVGDRAVHHQQVSLGQKPFYLTQQGGLCGLPTVDYTWTGERPVEWTPALSGYPIGGPENGGKARFLWQTHFEGATTYSGGFDVHITKNLRKYDAGNFEQGDVRGIMIPPMASHTHVAECTGDMTTQKLVHPIYVYASMLHAHLTIKHIKAEHYRNGQLINTFGDETTAGFLGFFDQSFHPHTPCIELLPGDELVTTCDYQNPFDFMVTGGEATNQEMCTTFMQYFPRLPGTSNNFCGTIDSTGGFNPGQP